MGTYSALQKEAGMTLIELLVVVTLLVVLSGFGALNLSGWNCRQNVTNDLSDLSTTITYLQSLAKDRNRSTVLKSSVRGTVVTYAYYQAKGRGRKEACAHGTFSSSKWEKIEGKTELDGTLLINPGLVCFHADGSVNEGKTKQWTVGKTCGPSNELTRYQLITHGSTGFVEKKKFNTTSNQWDEA